MAKAQGHQPESIVLNQVRDYLRALGWYVIRNQQNMGSHLGMSDLTAVKDGRVVFVECKAGGAKRGKLSRHQERFRDEIVIHGGRYVVAYCVDDVIEIGRQS